MNEEREKKMNYGWVTQNNIMENKKRKKRGDEDKNKQQIETPRFHIRSISIPEAV